MEKQEHDKSVPQSVWAPVFIPSTRRLLIVPLLIYIAWVLDTYLMEGSNAVFSRYQPFALILSTVVANVLIGVIVPVACLESAFLSGAVNMFQIGFRRQRRTLFAVLITGLSGYLILVLFSPYASDRLALLGMFSLMLPGAIATVMVCWVLVGTHIQAYVRRFGAYVSVITGVFVTGILFSITSVAHSVSPGQIASFHPFVLAGLVSAVFFFAVRDVYATVIFVGWIQCLLMEGHVDASYIDPPSLVVVGCAAVSVCALAACQQYLSKHFITVQIPVNPAPEAKNR